MPEKLPRGPIEFYLPQALLAVGKYALATKQAKQLEDIQANIQSKKLLDKSLQEMFDEEFKSIRKKKKKHGTK